MKRIIEAGVGLLCIWGQMAIVAAGAELKGSIPENADLIEAPPGQVAEIGMLTNISYVGEYLPESERAAKGRAKLARVATAPEVQTAPLNPAFLASLAEAAVPRAKTAATPENAYGWRSGPVDMSHLRAVAAPRKTSSKAFAASYDLRTLGKLTAVRNQGSYGTCWAHATYASLESSLLTGETNNFSENNLTNLHGFDWGFDDGGNANLSMAYLTRWDGPVNEDDDPYPDEGGSTGTETVRKHVQQVALIPPKAGATDNEAIKQAVMDHGALYVNYYHDDAFYNSTYKSYYFSGTSNGNHAVAIVGWDDNFAAGKFNATPAGNGAYIVRNSWGTSWGDSGYFYVSYYDAKFACDEIYAFYNAEATGNYGRVYSYDPLGWVSGFGTGSSATYWGANIFTAASSEELGAVGFYAASTNTAYDLYIYKGVAAGAPRSGTLAASNSGTCAAGYCTVALATNVALTNGQKFSIVLKLTTPDYYYPQAIEYAYSGYSSAAASSPGQSYYSAAGSTWTDLTAWDASANFCIKGYAGPAATGVTIASQPQSCTNASGTAASFSVTATGTAPLHYQWQKNTVNISLATNPTYAIAPVAAGDAGDYRCTVSNVLNAVTSAVATLTVLPAAPAAIWASQTNANDFTAAWSPVSGATSYRLDVATDNFPGGGAAADLFISEYFEGSAGNNKAIEIFNGTGAAVDLSNYRLWMIANGGSWPESTFNLSGTLAPGDVYVVVHASADYANLVNAADLTSGSLAFNGDDAVGLAKNISGSWTLIDAVGEDGVDPGSGWAVAGTANATVDHSLLRKSSVSGPTTNWTVSRGTSTADSEWILSSGGANIDAAGFGSHTFAGGGGGTPSYVPGYSNLVVSGTSQLVNGLAVDTVYYFRVRAVAGSVTGAYSAVTNVTTRTSGGGTPTVSFGVDRVVGEEGGASVSLPVVLSFAAAATVQVAIAGTALPGGTDFACANTTLVFTAASATSNLIFSIVDDALPEGPETARLALKLVSGATLGTTTQAVLVIRDNDAFSILAANLTSGTNVVNGSTTYDDPGGRILAALQPDIVLIQEWVLKSGTYRDFVNEYFGTDFSFSVESETGSYSKPNGIISRWPIAASGEWADSQVGDRDFAWAQIELPGLRNLHAVSVHLKATGDTDPEGDAETRLSEARALTNYIAQAGWSASDYLVLGGDLNLTNRSEQTLKVLTNVLSDAIQPADQTGDKDTNGGRNRPYDFILPNGLLDARHAAFTCQGYTFPNGMVFDTRRTWSSGLPPPALAEDSDATNMQHMAVLKLFEFETGINPPQAFAATPAAMDQINLSFTPNAAGDNVVIVWNSSGTFTAPAGTPPEVGSVFAGGTVLYTGAVSPRSHSGLAGCTTYHYGCWSYSATNYSSGLTAAAATPGPPAPALVWASATNATDFTAAWNAVPGISDYRVDVSSNGTFLPNGGAADLFFSEYIEGSSSEKYIEIFNGTGAGVDLANYALVLYANGTTLPTASNTLSGTLTSGGVAVYRNSSATNLIGTTSSSLNYNGDDAVGLWKISSGTWVDIFGRIGEDPGTAWTSGSFSTLDKTLVRKSTVAGGVTSNPASGFPTLATEWDQHDVNTESYLNSHVFAGGGDAFVAGYSNRLVSGEAAVSVTGLTAGATYCFRVRAADGTCQSGNSTTGQVSTLIAMSDQTITFPPIPAQVTTNAVGLTATASSGLPVDFGVGSGPATITDGTNLSFTGAGTVSIVASQTGNSQWNPAPNITNTFIVTKAGATVMLTGLTQIYNGAARLVTATSVPAGLTVGVTYNGSSTAPTNAGNYAVTGTVSDAMYQGATAGTLVVAKAAAAVMLDNLSQTYDGTARAVTASTTPNGLTVILTYNGNTWAPTEAGSYAVTGTVNDANYEGSASGTLVIGKAVALVTLGDMAQVYDGDPKAATATTEPEGLLVGFTYDGVSMEPTEAGSYAVTGTVNNANYEGSASGTLVIGKAVALVTLGDMAQVYDGDPKAATATTEPAGLLVGFTYDGGSMEPTEAGSYAVTGTVNDANYEGSAAGMLVIGKAAATVTLGDLAQVYDGDPKAATATTEPAGLLVGFTYDGGSMEPTEAGSYAVTGTVNDANYEGSAAGTLVIGKAVAIVTLGDLAQVYDGDPKEATATTEPAGLLVEFTYDGGATAPTEAGSYAVTGTVNDANYEGSVASTLVIGKAVAFVTLGDMAQVYDGDPKAATATTEPEGLLVGFTYDGGAMAPTDAGSYAVTGTVNDANYEGSAAGTLVIGKAVAIVTLGDLAQVYDGDPKEATATTEPEGLLVEFTYDGGATAPTEAGSYAVTGTVNNANYEGSVAGTLVIGKATATVTLGDLAQVYDGDPKEATATTEPEGLLVEFTYDGGSTAPTDAGSYAVTGTVNSANYEGSVAGTLVIGKATALVTLGELAQVYDGDPKAATATTEPEGLLVGFTYDGGSMEPTEAGSYAVTGTVNNANYEGSAAGTLVIAKATATVTLDNLIQTYDGDPKEATATTEPAGLLVEFTYDGGTTVPTDAGSYAVTGTVNSANYEGSAASTLVIGKAVAIVTLGDLAQVYNGDPKEATATTEPAGLLVEFTYDGGSTAPTDAGSYAVTGTVNSANYEGAAAGTLVVAKADQTIDFPAIGDQFTTATVGLAATATSGLPVEFTVSAGPATISGGTNLAFTGPGWVSIVASQGGAGNWNAAPDVTHTFKADAPLAEVGILSWILQASGSDSFSADITTIPEDAEVSIAVYGASIFDEQTQQFDFELLLEGADYTVDGKTVIILPNPGKLIQIYRIGATSR